MNFEWLPSPHQLIRSTVTSQVPRTTVGRSTSCASSEVTWEIWEIRAGNGNPQGLGRHYAASVEHLGKSPGNHRISCDLIILDQPFRRFSMKWHGEFQLQWENPWKSGCRTGENHPFSLDAAPFRWRGQGGSPALRSSGWPKAHRSLSHGPPGSLRCTNLKRHCAWSWFVNLSLICHWFVIDLSWFIMIYHDLSHPALDTPLSKGTIVVICCILLSTLRICGICGDTQSSQSAEIMSP